MVILELANRFLSVLRIGGIMEQIRLLPAKEQRMIVNDAVNNQEGNDFAFRARNDPASNRGTAFTATGPTTLKEQAELTRISEQNQTTFPFSGL